MAEGALDRSGGGSPAGRGWSARDVRAARGLDPEARQRRVEGCAAGGGGEWGGRLGLESRKVDSSGMPQVRTEPQEKEVIPDESEA
jgi:hypothetical protein